MSEKCCPAEGGASCCDIVSHVEGNHHWHRGASCSTFCDIVSHVDGRLLFAVPKKGRLHSKVIELLQGAGLDHTRKPRLDLAECTRLPVTLIFLPAKDIVDYVGKGNVHVGITGEDMISDSEAKDDVEVMHKLGFGKCKLAVQAPVGKVKDVNQLCGKTIVTSFPQTAREYFAKLDPTKETKIRYASGSVEVACALGLGDAIVDLVETGTTMRAAGLEIVSTIMETQCVLLRKKSMTPEEFALVETVRKRIEGYLLSRDYVYMSYNIPATKLDEGKMITPGQEAPTIQNTVDPNWISISALVKTKESSEIMDKLTDIGALSIICVSMSNCRFPSHSKKASCSPAVQKGVSGGDPSSKRHKMGS